MIYNDVTLSSDLVEAGLRILCVVGTATSRQLPVATDPVEDRFPMAPNDHPNSSAAGKYCWHAIHDLLAISSQAHPGGLRDAINLGVIDSPMGVCYSLKKENNHFFIIFYYLVCNIVWIFQQTNFQLKIIRSETTAFLTDNIICESNCGLKESLALSSTFKLLTGMRAWLCRKWNGEASVNR